MGTNTVWPEAAMERLQVLWREGLSASQISRQLFADLQVRYSRNAVIGKVHRLGLVGRKSPDAKVSRRSLAERAERAPRVRASKSDKPPAQKAPPPPLPSETPPETARPWNARKGRECQWIYGEPSADALTCCSPAQPGSPWCPSHARLIYQPGRVKERVDARLSIPIRKSA